MGKWLSSAGRTIRNKKKDGCLEGSGRYEPPVLVSGEVDSGVIVTKMRTAPTIGGMQETVPTIEKREDMCGLERHDDKDQSRRQKIDNNHSSRSMQRKVHLDASSVVSGATGKGWKDSSVRSNRKVHLDALSVVSGMTGKGMENSSLRTNRTEARRKKSAENSREKRKSRRQFDDVSVLTSKTQKPIQGWAGRPPRSLGGKELLLSDADPSVGRSPGEITSKAGTPDEKSKKSSKKSSRKKKRFSSEKANHPSGREYMDIDDMSPGENYERTMVNSDGNPLILNELATNQLVRWKTYAEEGPCLIQMLAFVLAICAILTTLYDVIVVQKYWSYSVVIVGTHTLSLCGLILVFELRGVGPHSSFDFRAKFRSLCCRYLNILRLLWGRGLLYIFAGSMNVALGWNLTLYTGLGLIVLGIVAIFAGARASFSLDRLRASVTDEVYLWTKFDSVDHDRDELIGVDGFSNLLWSLGLEVSEPYLQQMFVSIDRERRGLISFDQFKTWWFKGQEKIAKETRGIMV